MNDRIRNNQLMIVLLTCITLGLLMVLDNYTPATARYDWCILAAVATINLANGFFVCNILKYKKELSEVEHNLVESINSGNINQYVNG